jgi:hypothetical protein
MVDPILTRFGVEFRWVFKKPCLRIMLVQLVEQSLGHVLGDAMTNLPTFISIRDWVMSRSTSGEEGLEFWWIPRWLPI